MRLFWLQTILFTGLMMFAHVENAAAAVPSDAEVLDILKARVDTFKQGTGIVVGMVDSTGAGFVSYGTTHVDGDRPVDEHTLFEIGSISKVFTALVLTDMVRKGEVDLGDPVSKYLPAEITMPQFANRPITLQDLVTHRSGLPRMPNHMRGIRSEANDSVERMFAFLSTCTLVADTGRKFLYSNLGFGLLGHALANRDGSDLETVLRSRITGPLGLVDTQIRPRVDQTDRLAGGHDWNHGPVPFLKFGAMEGAGALKSTATDLIRFLSANIGLIETPIWKTLQFAHIDREDAIGRRVDIGMGWLLLEHQGREIILHNGATFGNMAFAAFDKEARRGVVVLANARGAYDDIGLHLLNPKAKLFRFENPPPKPAAVEIDIEKLKALEGEYALSANQVLIIRIEGDKIYGNQNEGIELEMKAASETELFFDGAPFVVSFVKNKQGKVTEAVSNAYGQETRADRLEFYRSPPTRATVDDNLDKYVGRYRISDDLTIAIRLDSGALVVEAEGQLPMRLTRTTSGFYAYEARAELVFEETGGQVTGVTIHQDGEHTGKRLDDALEGATP
jgi:serine-type D-Ala-D-Ala carboxypeptidase/endopeptidase